MTSIMGRSNRGVNRGTKWFDNTPLSVEQLEERLVPSMVDLTTAGAFGVINGAIFEQAGPQPTGTGVIRSFVRVQTANAKISVEQGYNTDARPLQFDENKSPQFTRSEPLSGVPIVTINGVQYREFLLDINQKMSQPLLSLDQLRIYVGSAPNLLGYDPTTNTLAGLTPLFDLNADGSSSNWITLNARIHAGSGVGDMFAYIPNSAFPADGSGYLYLYSRFGDQNGANGGFEEWSVRTNAAGQAVPPPSVAAGSLSGAVQVLDSNGNIVSAAGITITLNGTNDLGQTVVLTTTTDANGNYTFTNLRPGTYSIIETPTDSSTTVTETGGSLGGMTGLDDFYDVVLGAGQNGTGYFFLDQLTGSGSGSGLPPS
jgi:hypothetical protein